MRVLFDNGTPRGVASVLTNHTVEEARAHGWDTLQNGELLDAAEAAGFDVFVTTDRNTRFQQNLAGRKIAIALSRAAQDRSGRAFRKLPQQLPRRPLAVSSKSTFPLNRPHRTLSIPQMRAEMQTLESAVTPSPTATVFVHCVDGDLEGVVIRHSCGHLAAAGPTALYELLPAALTEAQTHRFVRSFLDQNTLGLSALLDQFEHVVGGVMVFGVIVEFLHGFSHVVHRVIMAVSRQFRSRMASSKRARAVVFRLFAQCDATVRDPVDPWSA